MSKTITIPYKPRTWAELLHESKERWKILVLHRRAGKTTAVLNHLQRDALTIPNSEWAYIAPTYKQAKRIAWKKLKFYAKNIPGHRANESELVMHYPNGSMIYLLGSENIDSLRGMGLHGGAQDESSQQPSGLFSEVISKCLAENLGYWIWLGTPKGKNEFYRTYNISKTDEDYLSIFRTIDDTINEETGKTIINLEVALEDDKKLVTNGEMTQEEFEQEWYCSFESAIKGSYYARQISQLHKENRYRILPYDELLPVFTVWDLGVGKNLAVGFYQATGKEVRMIDYWQGENKDGLPQAIKELENKPYLYGKHFAPHDIKHTEFGTGKTRIVTAKELGIDFEKVPELKVDDGIERGRLFFSRLWVDSNNCEKWLDAMGQYRQAWDDKRGCFIETPYKDWTNHKADIHRYASLVWEEFTMPDNDEGYYRRQYNKQKNKQPSYN